LPFFGRRIKAEHRQRYRADLGDGCPGIAGRLNHVGVGECEIPIRPVISGLNLFACLLEDIVVGDVGSNRSTDEIAGIRGRVIFLVVERCRFSTSIH
jgi:hypothetical protein